MTIEVRRARDDAERAAALDLRVRVFCEEQGVPREVELDEFDAVALHLVAVDPRGAVVGTCRLRHAGDTMVLGRLAVSPDSRRGGIAGAILGEAEREARDAGARRLALAAQTRVIGLYERAGYEAHGDRFVEAGIEHVHMDKAIA